MSEKIRGDGKNSPARLGTIWYKSNNLHFYLQFTQVVSEKNIIRQDENGKI